jgi:hypothetical protein
MRYKLTFLAGFTAGYVLGAKAGRKRYDLITDGFRRMVDSPAVQETAGVLQAQASGAFASAKSTVTAKVSETVSSRIGGGHPFGEHGSSNGSGSAAGNGSSPDPDSPPPYPQAGHEEFGGES